jgi:RNA polymerase sigma-70 factor, ECF subfamily
LDEAAVVTLAHAGEASAFEELLRRRGSDIRGLLMRLCRGHTQADDLAQETFLQAWRQLGSLKSYAAFGAWLRQIAVNTWLQVQRRTDLLSYTEDVPEVAAHEHLGEQIDLDVALQKLPPAVRLCVVLSHGEGMSHTEVASATGIPLGTVKSHISRGSAKLRELLGAYRPVEEGVPP